MLIITGDLQCRQWSDNANISVRRDKLGSQVFKPRLKPESHGKSSKSQRTTRTGPRPVELTQHLSFSVSIELAKVSSVYSLKSSPILAHVGLRAANISRGGKGSQAARSDASVSKPANLVVLSSFFLFDCNPSCVTELCGEGCAVDTARRVLPADPSMLCANVT